MNALDQILIPDVSTFRGNNVLFQCKISANLENVFKPTGWLVTDNNQQSQTSKLIDSLFIPIGTTKGEF